MRVAAESRGAGPSPAAAAGAPPSTAPDRRLPPCPSSHAVPSSIDLAFSLDDLQLGPGLEGLRDEYANGEAGGGGPFLVPSLALGPTSPGAPPSASCAASSEGLGSCGLLPRRLSDGLGVALAL